MSNTPEPVAAMPWEIIELPFRNGTRAYKRYPNGLTFLASDEEQKIWAAVEALRQDLAAARTPMAGVSDAPAQEDGRLLAGASAIAKPKRGR